MRSWTGNAATSTRYLGWCPVCEGDFKVRDGKLVHHGYQRPGYGHIVGDCFGVGYEPHETSPECAREWLKAVVDSRKHSESQLAALPSKTSLMVFDGEWTEIFKATTDRWKWREAYEKKERALKREIKSLVEEEQRVSRLVAGWSPKPLRSVEEDIVTKRVQQEQRHTAKQQERLAKLQETIARYQQRIDSAIKNKKAGVLVDVHEGARNKLPDLARKAGLSMTREEALASLQRDDVWRAFGLMSGDQYIIEPWSPAAKGPMHQALGAMRDLQYGYRGVWPDAAQVLTDRAKAEARRKPNNGSSGAGLVLVAPTGRCLLLCRHDGVWELPGGHVEAGEDPMDAALRELVEETGYDGPMDPDEQREHDGFVAYVCHVPREFRAHLSAEHCDAVWSDPDDPPEPLHPGVGPLL